MNTTDNNEMKSEPPKYIINGIEYSEILRKLQNQTVRGLLAGDSPEKQEKLIARYEILVKTERIFDDESEFSYETLNLPYNHEDVRKLVRDYFNGSDHELIEVRSVKILKTD